jgi:multidrug efflux pump subunit AcrA (membrane-fusion protein)
VIDDADYAGVGRNLNRKERERRLFAPDKEHRFTDSRSDRIDGDKSSSSCSAIGADRLKDEQRAASRAEKQRIAAEKAEAKRLEAERLAAERAEFERVKAENLAAEQADAERLKAAYRNAERVAENAARLIAEGSSVNSATPDQEARASVSPDDAVLDTVPAPVVPSLKMKVAFVPLSEYVPPSGTVCIVTEVPFVVLVCVDSVNVPFAATTSWSMATTATRGAS